MIFFEYLLLDVLERFKLWEVYLNSYQIQILNILYYQDKMVFGLYSTRNRRKPKPKPKT